jgi:hypothetical protein
MIMKPAPKEVQKSGDGGRQSLEKKVLRDKIVGMRGRFLLF